MSNGHSSSDNMNDLYQALILDHNKNPRNYKKLATATVVKEGFNPLCGDHLHLYLHIEKNTEGADIVKDISFEGEGCAISKASTSMMTQVLKGKTVAEAEVLFDEFHRLLMKKLDPHVEAHHLGKLEVFSGIWKFPARVKCAGLAWHTLKAALDDKDNNHNSEIVKTE